MKTKLTRMTSILLAALFLIAMFPMQALALDNGGAGGSEAGELQWICVSGTHSWDEGEVTTAATCTGTGVRTFTCTLCGATKTENISALGHAFGEWTVTTEPTCGNPGEKTRVCANDPTHVEVEVIAATGVHVPGDLVPGTDATCTEAGTADHYVCQQCGANIDAEGNLLGNITVSATGHTLVSTAAVAATCTTPGNNAYWTCSECGKYFSDENGENEIAADSWVIAATGHIYEVVGTAPTCTDGGYTTYTCSVCGDTYTGDETAALGHTLVPTTAAAATCEDAGNSAYWTCSECGKYFSDANGENEIAADSWVIAATGHTWVAFQEGDDIADFELKAEATTESAAVYYKNCSVDGTSAKGIDEDATFTYGDPLPAESDIMYGDADGDEEITSLDVMLLNQYFANLATLEELEAGADVDGDEEITSLDVMLLNQYFANLATLDDFGPQE